jgi:hypothetical protein
MRIGFLPSSAGKPVATCNAKYCFDCRERPRRPTALPPMRFPGVLLRWSVRRVPPIRSQTGALVPRLFQLGRRRSQQGRCVPGMARQISQPRSLPDLRAPLRAAQSGARVPPVLASSVAAAATAPAAGLHRREPPGPTVFPRRNVLEGALWALRYLAGRLDNDQQTVGWDVSCWLRFLAYARAIVSGCSPRRGRMNCDPIRRGDARPWVPWPTPR